jgi:glutathione S-transferase
MTLQFPRPFWMSFFSADGESPQGFLAEAKQNLALLETRLNGKRFFGGESMGLVDIAASLLAHWLGVMEEVGGVSPLLTDEGYPDLCRWARRYIANDTVKQCLPKREDLVAMYSAFKEMFQATAASQKS